MNLNIIFNKLPVDIIKYILSFDEQLVIINNEYIIVNKILKNDFRYNVLFTKKIISKMNASWWGVTIHSKYKKYVIIYDEMYYKNQCCYTIYIYNQHLKMVDSYHKLII
jgi:hypothetical protein